MEIMNSEQPVTASNVVEQVPIYIAGSWWARERLIQMKNKLEAMLPEMKVNSTWLTPFDATPQSGLTDEQKKEYAVRDIEEVANADGFILDTLDETSTAGREVEFGIAIGLGIPVMLIGPKRNIFHFTNVNHYATWEDFFGDLEKYKATQVVEELTKEGRIELQN